MATRPVVTYFVILMCLVQSLTEGAVTTTPAGRILGAEHPPSDEVSIAPIADCSGDLLDFGAQVRECFLDCSKNPEPIEGTTIQFCHMSGTGPRVVECTKLDLVQSFTQTWTFSTVASPLTVTRAPVTEDECDKEIARVCPNYDCNSREPDSLTPEYHYGSVTTKRASMIILTSSPSVLLVEAGKMRISPSSASVSFDIDLERGREGHTSYFWKKTTYPNDCPLKVMGEYGCDRFKDESEDFYACGGGRIALTPRKGNPDLWPEKCPGLKMSEEGFPYIIKKGDAKSDKYGRLAIDVAPGTQEAADASYLRHKIQQVAKKIDSDVCLNQCEILSLESRVRSEERRLVRSGMDSYLLMPNGTAKYCKPNIGCRLPEKITFCGNPPRVSIICNNVARYWNPLEPFTEPGTVCFKPDVIEKLTFNLGSTKYSVDDNLKIKGENHHFHHRYHNRFLEYHNSGMRLHIKEISDLKPTWDSSKAPMGGVASDRFANTTIDSPHITIGDQVMRGIRNVFSTVKSVEALIGIGIIICVIGASLMLLEKVTGLLGKIRGPYERVRVQDATSRVIQPSSVGTWI